MNTGISNSKKNIRLLIVLVYLAVSFPFQIRLIHDPMTPGPGNIFLKYTILSIVIVLELIEYFLNYPDRSRKVSIRTIFIIRTISVLYPFISTFLNTGAVDAFYFIFIPLLAFYSSFEMPLVISILYTVAITAINIFLDVRHFSSQELELSFSAVMIFQRLIIIAVFYLFAYFWQTDMKKSLENELLVKKLNKSEENLRIYASEIAKTSVLEERTRIAREMHDSVGHGLTAIQMQLRKALAFTEVNITDAEQAIEAALEVAGSSLQDTRSVLHALRDGEMNFSLEDEIKPVIETLRQAGLEVQLTVSGSGEAFNYAVLIALFRLVQEGATNVLKHADASHVMITIAFSHDAAELVMEDDGQGFDQPESSDSTGNTGLGLHGLRERFELIRGSLSVESVIGEGTRLTAKTPKDPVKLISESDE